jgi:cytochrome c-type protein NapC
MRDNVYKEYSENTIHYTNRTGVRATCPDCHVPKEWGPKMMRKVQATRELYGKATGQHRHAREVRGQAPAAGRREWARMKANDSLECRNCHTLKSMDVEKQKPRAKKSHELAVKNNETCIDCHKGIAHHKPKGMKEEDEWPTPEAPAALAPQGGAAGGPAEPDPRRPLEGRLRFACLDNYCVRRTE